MHRFGFIVLALFLAGCGGKNGGSGFSDEDDSNTYSEYFKEMTPPYALSDSGLLANKDTTLIRSAEWESIIPDSVAKDLFGSAQKVKYTPLGMFKGKKKETYFLVKGTRENRKAALIVVKGPEQETAVLPFLKPDTDASTKQKSSFEANFSVVRSTTRKLANDILQDGKEVYAYSDIGKTFDLVMTDQLDDAKLELINPIDTLGKTFTYAGDYGKDKRNLVSVRDGRKKGLITVFVHIEKNDGTCTGEIKGDAELVDETTAIYRTAGDPCVMTIKFGKSAVTLEEQEGCGSRRDLECSFNGSFNKRKGDATAKGKAE